MKLDTKFLGWSVVMILSMSQENNAMTLADRGRKLQGFEGLCMDCGYFIPNMHCDLLVPCTKETCRKECVHDGPWVNNENRPSVCDKSQNRNPEVYECWWDNACAENERCCITDSGSYCSS
ncbi:uncharacterized protein LOC125678955 isoform X2 [Ostrea edulis]|uniref:uncharacterized protein LOC125678955 isoform X2 n=1 Tax=Ostrea edulis TaxID=37623 RepID=UPI0024AEC2D9|nr:uncharacterized protein LOC125678955 isoform X2 [Ostrea edulis]